MVDGKCFTLKIWRKKKQYLKHDFNLGVEFFKKTFERINDTIIGPTPRSWTFLLMILKSWMNLTHEFGPK
jgi:hypothetical protein